MHIMNNDNIATVVVTTEHENFCLILSVEVLTVEPISISSLKQRMRNAAFDWTTKTNEGDKWLRTHHMFLWRDIETVPIEFTKKYGFQIIDVTRSQLTLDGPDLIVIDAKKCDRT